MTGPIERLLKELSREGIRYMVVGGVAVVLHGYLRATADLDIFLDLEQANVDLALDFFEREGFQPRAPVSLRSFADAAQRRQWKDEKNMLVFSLWHPALPGFEIDIFVDEPVPFSGGYERASEVLLDDVPIRVAAIDDLIRMKQISGRARDAEDIAALEELKKSNARR